MDGLTRLYTPGLPVSGLGTVGLMGRGLMARRESLLSVDGRAEPVRSLLPRLRVGLLPGLLVELLPVTRRGRRGLPIGLLGGLLPVAGLLWVPLLSALLLPAVLSARSRSLTMAGLLRMLRGWL